MRKRTAAIVAIIIILILGAVGAYTAIGIHYRTHFFEHTTINGIDVSDLTVQEAEGLIADQAEDYSVKVRTKALLRLSRETRSDISLSPKERCRVFWINRIFLHGFRLRLAVEVSM